ncbi:MAG: hypothetical protein ACRDRW_02440 [Pseudonocardiaceae bacterium]
MRLVIGGLVMAALALGGCASSRVSLDSQPQDQRSGRALARTVADTANCPNFEDDDLSAADHWDFTCQKPDQTFSIRVVANPTAREKAIKELGADGKPYKAGRFFVVNQAIGENHVNTPEDLKQFPGEPGARPNGGSRS